MDACIEGCTDAGCTDAMHWLYMYVPCYPACYIVHTGPTSASLSTLLHANLSLIHHTIHTSGVSHDSVHARDMLLDVLIRRDAQAMKHVLLMCSVLQGARMHDTCIHRAQHDAPDDECT